MIFWKCLYISQTFWKSVETCGFGWGDTYILEKKEKKRENKKREKEKKEKKREKRENKRKEERRKK